MQSADSRFLLISYQSYQNANEGRTCEKKLSSGIAAVSIKSGSMRCVETLEFSRYSY